MRRDEHNEGSDRPQFTGYSEKVKKFLASWVACFSQRPPSDAMPKWVEFVERTDIGLLCAIIDRMGADAAMKGDDGTVRGKPNLPYVAHLYKKAFEDIHGKQERPYSKCVCSKCHNQGLLKAVYGYSSRKILAGQEWNGKETTTIVIIPCLCDAGGDENAKFRYPEALRIANAKRGYCQDIGDTIIYDMFCAEGNRKPSEKAEHAKQISKYSEVEEAIEEITKTIVFN